MKTGPNPFSVKSYSERVTRQIPGLRDLHKMVGLLLAEKVSDRGQTLALGAGGGMELKALRRQHPNWTFAAVDPSSDMINQAIETLEGDMSQITFTQGYIDDAAEAHFDGAICLLVLHFLTPSERLRTLQELHRRLRPGGPLIVVHHSFSQENGMLERWLNRYADFQIANGLDPRQARSGVDSMKEKLPALSPDQDESILREAGFECTELFYSALTFKGWITYASESR